jgi:integrase
MPELQGKLYFLVKNLQLPAFAVTDPVTKSLISKSEVRPAGFSLSWPNGYPCIPGEMYLLERSATMTMRSGDGGSPKVLAAQLSLLLRLCWNARKELVELVDDDLRSFIEILLNERKRYNPRSARRNRNTVNRIIASWIGFFQWMQETLYTDRTFIGPRAIGPQLTCVEKSYCDYRGNRRNTLVYAYSLTPDIQDPKKAISTELREKLWDTISNLCDANRYSARYMARYSVQEFTLELEYLRARRELELTLLEATGCRPSELARFMVTENADCYRTGKIVMTTMKRKTDPQRKVPVDGSVCIKVETFIKRYRRDLIDSLSRRGVNVLATDAVFLCSRKGTALSEQTLTKDFQRLVYAAQVDQRACMSMFRHRFITMMVVIHLREFMEVNPVKTRPLITDADYLSILKRVTVFTGHGDPKSLLHYIDLAWEEVGAFDYVQPAYDLVCAVEQALHNIRTLSNELSTVRGRLARTAINRVTEELNAILLSTSKALHAANVG